jgi:protein involved in polysaccharide export with SLBB domain
LRNSVTGEAKTEEETHTPESTGEAGPITVRSDFERFAEDAAGHPLQVYGRSLFNNVPSTFAPVDHIPVPANYAIGPGDQLLIRAWGKIDLDSRVTVDRNGQISLPKVGVLNVAGLRYEQLDGFLRTAIGTIFKGFELNVTLGHLRSIQVFVVGSARQPGAYTVSSLSTLVNTLFASGGPSATGTMRRIQLRRADRVFTEFDIYDLLRKGDKSHDVQLLPGDVIYIPPVGPQVAIVENVNEPGIYELKDDTTVASALGNAGGLTNLAGVDRVLLERIEDHRRRRVDEFTLDASGLQRTLKDGDLLRIFPVSPQFDNAVTLRGNVAQPGRYVWHEGMRVKDLIPSRDSLITRGHWIQENHQTEKQLAEPTEEQHTGPAEKMGTDIMTDLDLTNSEINWDYATIERLDQHDLSTSLIAFNLGDAIDNPASSDNRLLKAGDVIIVFSRKDIPLPIEKHSTFVRVGGEVNAPGVYRVNPGDTLRDVVQRGGGLTQHSYLYASILTRVSTRLAQEAQLRQSSEQMQRELVTKYANATPQAGQTGTDQQAQLAMQQAALARLTAIVPTGRVVLDMKPEAATVADIPDLPLEDGDTYYIPPRLSTVQVAGAVYNANAFRYEPGERLITYLNDAGGATREADPKRIFVIRADGTVVGRQSRNMLSHGKYENLRLLPGDAIIVPEKLRVSSPLNNFLQATNLVSQTAVTAAALSVIK